MINAKRFMLIFCSMAHLAVQASFFHHQESLTLHAAVREKNILEVQRMLAQDAKKIINKVDRSGKTALQIAAQTGDDFMIKTLLAHGANINQLTTYGTVLTVAVAHAQYKTVQLLLEQTALKVPKDMQDNNFTSITDESIKELLQSKFGRESSQASDATTLKRKRSDYSTPNDE